MALVPQAAYVVSRDALSVSTFETSSATLELKGQRVTVEQQSQTFTLRLSNPEKALAVRVLGVPACGHNPKQAFSSCSELQAFQ
jgi:hypothetical protein